MTASKQRKYDIAYLKMAQEWAKLSHCKRKQVGALIVKDKMIISDGYNELQLDLRTHVKTMKIVLNGMFFMQRQMRL